MIVPQAPSHFRNIETRYLRRDLDIIIINATAKRRAGRFVNAIRTTGTPKSIVSPVKIPNSWKVEYIISP